MAEYPTTAVPFDGMRLPDLRDPVLAGAGGEGVGAAGFAYFQLSSKLEQAVQDIEVVILMAQRAHEGPAADASMQYLRKIKAVGELGAAEARISQDALRDTHS